ncbi:MAG: MBL fold metallo-hydrolase [Spirochaetaceae bacterium]|nr:MBL fold metallo-hydrolase [Spirochaetaceae bacterium]
MAVFGGNTTCVEIRAGNRLLIIDAGTGIRNLGSSLVAQKNGPLNADIFLTHSHMDHICGFLMFQPFFDKNNTFRVYGPLSRSGKKMNEVIDTLFTADYWPIGLSALPSALEWKDLQEGMYDIGDGVIIKTLLLEHPAPNFGYRIEFEGKSMAFVFDHEGYLQSNEKVVSFLRGADLVVMDSQYTEEEYYRNRQGWGHNSFEKSIATAEEAGVKDTLVFFHHDPDRTDKQLAELEKKYARQTNIKNVYAAKENTVFEV